MILISVLEYNKADMPGITIHLAAANEYLNMHPEENRSEFLLGAIDPDYLGDTSDTHHSSPDIFSNGLAYLVGKVNLGAALSDFDFKTSYGRGYFFHLMADEMFYREVSEMGLKFEAMSYKELRDLLYNDYAVSSNIMKNKYCVVFPEKCKEYDLDVKGNMKLLSIDELSAFVERIGALDLDDYYSKI